VFLPVITEAASSRGCVHQEIGYAMAMNVPVVPVTVGTWPGQMLQNLHAVHISEAEAKGDLEPLKSVLTFDMFDNLVNRFRDSSFALYRTAEFTEDRAMMLADYANGVLALRRTGLVRQKGALSSFHIPCNVITDPLWRDRYGSVHMAWFHKRVLREERLALGKHAQVTGWGHGHHAAFSKSRLALSRVLFFDPPVRRANSRGSGRLSRRRDWYAYSSNVQIMSCTVLLYR